MVVERGEAREGEWRERGEAEGRVGKRLAMVAHLLMIVKGCSSLLLLVSFFCFGQ